jgi:hypothetical protein
MASAGWKVRSQWDPQKEQTPNCSPTKVSQHCKYAQEHRAEHGCEAGKMCATPYLGDKCRYNKLLRKIWAGNAAQLYSSASERGMKLQLACQYVGLFQFIKTKAVCQSQGYQRVMTPAADAPSQGRLDTLLQAAYVERAAHGTLKNTCPAQHQLGPSNTFTHQAASISLTQPPHLRQRPARRSWRSAAAGAAALLMSSAADRGC